MGDVYYVTAVPNTNEGKHEYELVKVPEEKATSLQTLDHEIAMYQQMYMDPNSPYPKDAQDRAREAEGEASVKREKIISESKENNGVFKGTEDAKAPVRGKGSTFPEGTPGVNVEMTQAPTKPKEQHYTKPPDAVSRFGPQRIPG